MDQLAIVYIEKLLAEVSDQIRQKTLLAAQLELCKRELQETVELKNKLEHANNDLLAKLKRAKKGEPADV